jgi:hypothetical protein
MATFPAPYARLTNVMYALNRDLQFEKKYRAAEFDRQNLFGLG